MQMDEEIDLIERNGLTTVNYDLLMGKISVFHQCFVWESNYQTMRLCCLYNKLLWIGVLLIKNKPLPLL